MCWTCTGETQRRSGSLPGGPLYLPLPQLVAGPIVRYTTVAGEIVERRESLSEFSAGAVRFLFGLGKKMLLANQLGLLADQVYGTGSASLTTTLAWLGALAYTGQIYFDFSAYSDMAIGLGRMFGFHFLENFDYPYISKSITEFWRRWHISLVHLVPGLRLYPPGRQPLLQASACPQHPHRVGPHRPVARGGLELFMLGPLLCPAAPVREIHLGQSPGESPLPLRHGYALVLVVLGWVLFRAESLSYAGQFVQAMFGGAAGGLTDGRTVYYLLQFRWELLLAVPAALPVRDWLQAALEKRRDKPWAVFVEAWCPKAIALGLFAFSFLRLVSSSFNPFIYFRF